MNLFIGGSTSDIIADRYFSSVRPVVERLVKYNDIGLVAGDYPRGIMAIPYEKFKSQHKKVIAILKKKFDVEDVTRDSGVWLRQLYEQSDMFLFFPGGIEIYEMLFYFIQENKRRDLNKKIIIYNVDYFFTPMIKELYRLYEEKFIEGVPSEYIVIESNQNKLIELIEEERDLWKN